MYGFVPLMYCIGVLTSTDCIVRITHFGGRGTLIDSINLSGTLTHWSQAPLAVYFKTISLFNLRRSRQLPCVVRGLLAVGLFRRLCTTMIFAHDHNWNMASAFHETPAHAPFHWICLQLTVQEPLIWFVQVQIAH